MAEHSGETQRPYMKVFGALALLTLIEVLVAFLPIAKILIVIFLIALALTKALLVAMYFMHLKYDRRILTLIAASPLILAAILALALLPDIAFQP